MEATVTPYYEKTVLLLPSLYLMLFASLEKYFIKKIKSKCICFKNTAFLIPQLFVWILFPLNLDCIKNRRSECSCGNWMSRLKLVLLDILVVCFTLEVVGGVFMTYYEPKCWVKWIVLPFLQLLTFVLAYYLVSLRARAGGRSSGVIFIFWAISVICGAPCFWEILNQQVEPELRLLLVIKYPCMVISFILNFFAEPGKQPKNVCPEKISSFPSRMTFAWVSSLVLKCFFRTLKQRDLWSLEPENSLETIYQKFDQQWSKESSAACENSTYNGCKNRLFWPLAQAFGPTFLVAALYKLIADVLVFFQPFLMTEVYMFTENGSDVWDGCSRVMFLTMNFILKTLVEQQQQYNIKLFELRVQSAINSAIYNKVLKVSHSFRHDNPAADVINLLTNDVGQLVNLLFYFNLVWTAPIQIIVVFVVLWYKLGVSALVGVVVMLVATVLSIIISRIVKGLQDEHRNKKGKRLQLIQEILLSMKVIKLNVWEECFEQKTDKIRQEESSLLKKLNLWQSFSSIIWNVGCILVQFSTFYVFVLMEDNTTKQKVNELTHYKALESFLYFMQLQMPFSLLPYLFSAYSEAQTSLERIGIFLNAGEFSENREDYDVIETDTSVEIKDSTFAWQRDNTAVLRNISLTVRRGSLVGVVGPVGCGKSTLLSAILGEMEILNGRIKVQKSVAIMPQQAWVRNDTVKRNITLCGGGDEAWYKKVLWACALQPDLAMLPDGDETTVGDQGMNLSGGQKHRVSLARAVFSLRDLYLLDDPLSAFDAVVGRQIFERVIGPNGLLNQKAKTRIFVTHNLNYLDKVDTVVFMENGSIAEMGTFADLMEGQGAFAKYAAGKWEQKKSAVDDLMPTSESQDVYVEDNVEPNTSSPGAQDIDNSNRENDIPEVRHLLDNVQKEERLDTGRVKASVYWVYFKLCWGVLLFSAFPLLLNHVVSILALWSLECWSGSRNITINNLGSCEAPVWLQERCYLCKNTTDNEFQPPMSNLEVLGAILSLGLSAGVLRCIMEILLCRRLLNIGLRVHKQMLRGVLSSPLSFLASTPVGHVITRFSDDINVLDYALPHQIFEFWLCVTGLLFTSYVIMSKVRVMAFYIMLVLLICIMFVWIYLRTNRNLRRLQVISVSQINSLLSESYRGASSIRTFGIQKEFKDEFDSKLVYLQCLNYHFAIVTSWLHIRLELLGIAVMTMVSLYGVHLRKQVLDGVSDGKDLPSFGLIIMFASHIIFWIIWSVRSAANIDTSIISFERSMEYQDLPPEEDNKNLLTSNREWLTSGKLQIHNLSARYRKQFVLRDINFSVEPGQKIGVVGRTGAGKSSLALVVFGALKPERGEVIIDETNIASIPLKELRSRLAIIPQDPVLFTGTLRMNLDPLESKTDGDIWATLETVPTLKEFVTKLGRKEESVKKGLDLDVTDEGANLSVGEKQVICLIRALLRKSKVLIMDEATSAMDLEMERLIHETIRREFSDSTVFIIAHRLNTVLDADKVMVVDEGRIIEFDSPANLKSSTSSIFHKMIQNAGLLDASGN